MGADFCDFGQNVHTNSVVQPEFGDINLRAFNRLRFGRLGLIGGFCLNGRGLARLGEGQQVVMAFLFKADLGSLLIKGGDTAVPLNPAVGMGMESGGLSKGEMAEFRRRGEEVVELREKLRIERKTSEKVGWSCTSPLRLLAAPPTPLSLILRSTLSPHRSSAAQARERARERAARPDRWELKHGRDLGDWLSQARDQVVRKVGQISN